MAIWDQRPQRGMQRAGTRPSTPLWGGTTPSAPEEPWRNGGPTLPPWHNGTAPVRQPPPNPGYYRQPAHVPPPWQAGSFRLPTSHATMRRGARVIQGG